VIGLVLAAGAACAGERWNLATACLTLAGLLKIYPIAMGLLRCLVYPRQLSVRLLIALPLGFVLPFLLQRPDYVLAQYRDWLALLQTDDRTWWPLENSYRDAWVLCRLARLPLSHTGSIAVQLLAAAAVAGLCLASRLRHGPGRTTLTTLTVLGTGWMTLFGPATESCTYVLLAPALAWEVVRGWERSPRPALGPIVAYLLLLSSYVAVWFPGGRAWQALGPQPLAALVLFALALAGAVRPGRAVSLHGTAT
jgi:hypothetical protein